MVFNPALADDRDMPVQLPCGRCIGCRLERSRQWAVRCMHESTLHDRNAFITLTFRPEDLVRRQDPFSLSKRDFQLFIKRLRKAIAPRRVSYFGCGEYGEQFGRPHYHACVFGYDFPDRELWSVRGDVRLYRSAELEQLWPFGFATVGDVTFESAAYVARYIMKKVTGPSSKEHYQVVDEDTGEVLSDRLPEFTLMSLKPAIGRGWIDRWIDDVYPSDQVIVNGKAVKPPRYYDKVLEVSNPFELDVVLDERARKARELGPISLERLSVLERSRKLKVGMLPRSVE